MNLQAITIGIVPNHSRGASGSSDSRRGCVGRGSDRERSPGRSTARPRPAQSRSTPPPRVRRIVWVMGDGSTVVCTRPGTRYEDRYGRSPSPTCGYAYSRTGTYTVSATSYWDVSWTGGGSSGVIPLSFTRSASITMGEIQVITTG